MKKRHVASKWRAEWTKYHLKPSAKGSSYAFCTICNMDFSVAGGGLHEVKRHCGSLKHSRLVKESVNQPSISTAFERNSPSLQDQVTTAELFFTAFIAEHNLSFATADHFTKLCFKMFPDSKIAQNYSYARTKTAAIIKHTLAAAANAHVIEACTTTPFTILCDGGNDQYDKKYFRIMVRFWDDDIGRVVTQFLGMPVCNIATGQSLFDALSHKLASRGIPWSNVTGFASDSASVMVVAAIPY